MFRKSLQQKFKRATFFKTSSFILIQFHHRQFFHDDIFDDRWDGCFNVTGTTSKHKLHILYSKSPSDNYLIVKDCNRSTTDEASPVYSEKFNMETLSF